MKRALLIGFVALAFCILAATTFGQALPSGTPNDWAAQPYKWKAVGGALMAKAPAHIRSGVPYEKLRYLYQEYSRLLVKHNVPLNGSFGTRATVSLTLWTCGNHALNLENLFNGSGLSLQYTMVRSAPSTWLSYIAKGVNCDHGALGVVIEGVVVIFDPWLPAFLSKRNYSNSMQIDYGGIPYPLWEMVVRREGYNSFQAGQETWRPTLKAALEAASLSSSTLPMPPLPQRTMTAGHWRLVEVRCMKYTESDPDSAVGALFGRSWFWWHPGEPNDSHLARVQVTSAMSPHAAVLIPNTSLSVAASMFENTPEGGKIGVTSCSISWLHEDSQARPKKQSSFDNDKTLGRWNKEAQLWRQSASFSIPIPSGQPGEAFRIFMVSPPGSVRCTYGWVAGGSPQPEPKAPHSFTGRWQTDWGVIELKAAGNQVKGTYPHDGGKITGVISAAGRVLTGTWSELPSYKPPKDGGDLVFTLSDDGKSFKGEYWYGKRPEGKPGSSWNGKRLP